MTIDFERVRFCLEVSRGLGARDGRCDEIRLLWLNEAAKELRFNPYHDPKNGRFTSGNKFGVDFSGESGIINGKETDNGRFDTMENPDLSLDNIKKSDIIKLEVGKSLSAGAKNYPVKLPEGKQHVKLSEGQTISGTTFAGKGTSIEIKDKFRLEATYGIAADKWEKVSGKGKIIVENQTREAELHWYQAEGEIVEMKVKRYLDEN